MDFIGDVSWFLGQRYEWNTDNLDGNVSCHVSQQAFVEGLLEKHGMTDCTLAKTPFRSGCKIDRIEDDGIAVNDKKDFITKYKSIMGRINWLCINTQPAIATAYKLLSQFNCKPSKRHMDAAKYVMRYLEHIFSHGLPDVFLYRMVFPETNFYSSRTKIGVLRTRPNHAKKTRIVSMEELKSIQGFYITTRMGGPLCWGVTRKKRGSRSSCIAKLKSMDEGIKGIQFLRHLMKQVGLPDVDEPTPILNNNRGSLDWSESGCRPIKKLRHENLSELGIEEAKNNNEVSFHRIPGSTNP